MTAEAFIFTLTGYLHRYLLFFESDLKLLEKLFLLFDVGGEFPLLDHQRVIPVLYSMLGPLQRNSVLRPLLASSCNSLQQRQVLLDAPRPPESHKQYRCFWGSR